MGLIFLADTNIVSEMMRSNPNKSVQSKWEENEYKIAISSTTWHELLTGVYRLPPSKRRTIYEDFLQKYTERLLSILPYDHAAARWHASERARLMQVGKTPSYGDGQIAAVAATNGLTLITRNVSDFFDFNALPIENWFE